MSWIERVRVAAERRCAVLRAELAEVIAAEVPGVSAEPTDEGVSLSGRGLRFRSLVDARLQALARLVRR